MNANASRRLTRGLCAFGLAALCVGGLPSVHANNKDRIVQGDSAVVKFGDLNLRNPAGVDELYRRIQRAADKVCWDARDIHVLNNIAQRECVRNAIAKAVGDVDNRNLTALYARKANKALG